MDFHHFFMPDFNTLIGIVRSSPADNPAVLLPKAGRWRAK
jgi:hypothetical protein